MSKCRDNARRKRRARKRLDAWRKSVRVTAAPPRRLPAVINKAEPWITLISVGIRPDIHGKAPAPIDLKYPPSALPAFEVGIRLRSVGEIWYYRYKYGDQPLRHDAPIVEWKQTSRTPGPRAMTKPIINVHYLGVQEFRAKYKSNRWLIPINRTPDNELDALLSEMRRRDKEKFTGVRSTSKESV